MAIWGRQHGLGANESIDRDDGHFSGAPGSRNLEDGEEERSMRDWNVLTYFQHGE